jgi:NAD(P)-dependent dehydrogenase (short-subunit alcohol dehydrogenase family)
MIRVAGVVVRIVLFHEWRLRNEVKGKHIVVTGATDGIGECLAGRLAEAGAHVTIVGRNQEKITKVKKDILDNPKVKANRVKVNGVLADCSKLEECERAVKEIQDLTGHKVDVLVCNVGLSIRRSVKYEGGSNVGEAKTNRFHDFERLMKLNYFGSLKTMLGLIPDMKKQNRGQIVHVSSFAVPMRQTRFAGYMASKSALDSAMQAIAGEYRKHGITTSSVYMPLVKTKMIQSKGNDYSWMPIFSTVDAAMMIERSIITKEHCVMDLKSKVVDYVYFFVPRIVILFMSLLFDLEKERNPDDPKSPAKTPSKSPVRNPSNPRTLLRAGTGALSPQVARKAAVKVGHSFGLLHVVGSFLKFINYFEHFLTFLIFGPCLPFISGFFACLVFIRDIAIFIRPCTDIMLKYFIYWPAYILYCAMMFKVRPGGYHGILWWSGLFALTINAFYVTDGAEDVDEDSDDEDEVDDGKELEDVRTEDEAEPKSR